MIDSRHDKYLRSIHSLQAVAGVLVSNEKDLVLTSNRGEKTVGIFSHGEDRKLEKVRVGGFPNGLAFDPTRERLLVANVSPPDDPTPITISIVDLKTKLLSADIPVPGRTRWTVFDAKSNRFFVNIAKPSKILAIEGTDPDGIDASYAIPATGPHGLDIDPKNRRLYCACDQGVLFTLDLESGEVSKTGSLTGAPDVIFYNSNLDHLYVAVGDPGVIDVFDTKSQRLVQTVKTEQGAHTIGFHIKTNKVYAFLPETHRASTYIDT